MREPDGDDATLDRRALLRRGAVLGGTLVWAAPVVQSLPASAFATVGSPPPHEPPPQDPPKVGELPSHGFFLVRRNSDNTVFGYQVSGSGQLGALGVGGNVSWLAANGWPSGSYIRQDSRGDTRWGEVRALISAGAGTGYYLDTTVTPHVQRLAYRVHIDASRWPIVGAWIFDGSFQKDPDGDSVRPAVLLDGVYHFPKV